MDSFGKFFWGVLLLVAGIIWLSFVMDWIDDLDFLKHWWPMIIIIPCVLRLMFANDRFLSIMGIIIGVIWQIHYIAPETVDLHMARMSMAPVAIICLGLHMLLGRRMQNCNHKHHHH